MLERRSRYLTRPDSLRCLEDITLRDGSAAQCQRFRTRNSRYCTQHTKLMYAALREPTAGSRIAPAKLEGAMTGEAEVLLRVTEVLPTLTRAVQQIMASDPAHTIESAVAELCQHCTPGQPDSPALAGPLLPAAAAPVQPVAAPSAPSAEAPAKPA